jgi:hypothetical protein
MSNDGDGVKAATYHSSYVELRLQDFMTKYRFKLRIIVNNPGQPPPNFTCPKSNPNSCNCQTAIPGVKEFSIHTKEYSNSLFVRTILAFIQCQFTL